jgi:hypothetical protein
LCARLWKVWDNVKVPMIRQVDNQGVCELVNNWSVGGITQHVATNAMFLQELKEWGLLVVKYLPGGKCVQICLPRICKGHCSINIQSILVKMMEAVKMQN